MGTPWVELIGWGLNQEGSTGIHRVGGQCWRTEPPMGPVPGWGVAWTGLWAGHLRDCTWEGGWPGGHRTGSSQDWEPNIGTQ